jgi:hypothetical protein
MWRTESEERRVQVRLQAYRFELRPDRNQRHPMRRFAGSCRSVFNRALGLQKELFELSGAHAGYADLCAVLVDWKQEKETDWLNEAPSQALQQSLKNLDAAGTTPGLVEEAETGPNQWHSTEASELGARCGPSGLFRSFEPMIGHPMLDELYGPFVRITVA